MRALPRLLLPLLALLLLTRPFLAEAPTAAPPKPTELPLWPDGAPGAKGKNPADVPAITVYLPEPAKATGAAVVICPGGGYGGLASSYEGHDVARWLNSVGVAGVVLRYRHSPYRHPVPLQDAHRAIRFTRAHAQEWKIDPGRVGILGFSAGGHLASTAATHFDVEQGRRQGVDALSSRPDFAVLVYPVITLKGPYAHGGSRDNLLGQGADPQMVDYLSNDTQVTDKTPPCFLVHTSEDTVVPPENSVLFYLALHKAKVPAELHVFEKGQHGLGLGRPGTAYAHWPELCAAWMRERQILGKK